MICPGCGCEQRASERCVQCQLAMPAHLVKGTKSATIARIIPPPPPPDQGGMDGEVSGSIARNIRPVEAEVVPRAVEAAAAIPIRGMARKSPVAEGQILITTTQQIEGRTIGAYFGLINANAIIEVDNDISSPAGDLPLSTEALYRKHFKNATLLALRDLRREATILGANAVIAVSFNFQKMEGGLFPTLLLSAVGTAVKIEPPR